MSKRPLNQVLGHADEADGIEEYDNPLPNWWLGLFYICIVWAVVYTGWYHLGGRSQVKTLAAEMADAEQRWPKSTQEAKVELTPAAIAAGKQVYATNCVGCHGAELQGGIGPNLVDTTWIHGGAPEQVVATITNGVAAKGMPPWGPVLGPEKVGQVAAYVISRGRHEGAEAAEDAGAPAPEPGH